MTTLQTPPQPRRTGIDPSAHAGDRRPSAGSARTIGICVLVGICALAGVAVLYATRESIGLSPDSRGYLMAAHSVREGRGVRILDSEGRYWPMTQLAPFYSVMLAGVSHFTPTTESAVRALNLSLFVASIALVWVLVRESSNGSLWAALVAAILVALAPDVLQIHSMVWSESAFLFFALCFILFLDRAMRLGDSWGPLILAAIAVSLAFLTRYSGAALVLAGGIALLLESHRPMRTRFRRATIFGLISTIASLAWFARNRLIGASIANRNIAFHPPTGADAVYALKTVARWFIPVELPRAVQLAVGGLILLAAVCLFVIWLRRDRTQSPARHMNGASIAGLLAVCYVIFILVSKTLVDAHTQFDQRILMPVYVCSLLYLIPRISRWIRESSSPFPQLRRIVAAIVVLLLLAQAGRAAVWVQQAPDRWLGYGTRKWGKSELLSYVRTLPPDAIIYSNADDLIYLRTGRYTRPIPKVTDPVGGARSPSYLKRVRLMHAKLSRGGYVVYFTTVARTRDYRMSLDELKETLALPVVHTASDGLVFFAKPPATAEP